MKTMWVFVALVILVIALHAYKGSQTSGVSGRISPPESAQTVWAIQGKDSLKTVPANGAFLIELKPGLYRIIVDAREPYKDLMMESVEVVEGKTTDLGEIRVSQ